MTMGLMSAMGRERNDYAQFMNTLVEAAPWTMGADPHHPQLTLTVSLRGLAVAGLGSSMRNTPFL